MLEIPPLLLAFGVDDLLKYLTPFVFLIVWVVSQIMEAKKKGGQPLPKDQPANPPQPVEQPPKRMAAQPQAADAPAGDSLREQVDEFFRRAGGGEKPQDPRPAKQRPRPAAASDIEILLDDQAAVPRRERLAEPLRPMERSKPKQPQPSQKPARSNRPAPALRQETAVERAAERIDSVPRTEAFKASRLGQRIVQDDAQFDINLQSRFDHQVGTFSSRTAAASLESATIPADSPAAQIAAMLSSPQGAQQAIVLNEILRRPVDRW